MSAINPYVRLTIKDGKYYLHVMLPISGTEKNVEVEFNGTQTMDSEGIDYIVRFKTTLGYSGKEYVLTTLVLDPFNPLSGLTSKRILVLVNSNNLAAHHKGPKADGKTIIQFEDALEDD